MSVKQLRRTCKGKAAAWIIASLFHYSKIKDRCSLWRDCSGKSLERRTLELTFLCLRLLLSSLARAICRRAQAAELASASQPAQPAAARAASISGHRVTFAETQRSAAQEPAVAPAAAAATAAAVNNSADPSATMAAFAALAARRPELRSYLGSVSAGRGFQLPSRLLPLSVQLSQLYAAQTVARTDSEGCTQQRVNLYIAMCVHGLLVYITAAASPVQRLLRHSQHLIVHAYWTITIHFKVDDCIAHQRLQECEDACTTKARATACACVRTGAAAAATSSSSTANSISTGATGSSRASRNSNRSSSSSSASDVALLAAAVQDSINAKQQFEAQLVTKGWKLLPQ
eukprot:2397-Heterococcus_DN1.PRE.1